VLAPFDTPELLRIPLDVAVLRIRYLDVGGSQEVLGACMDPPEPEAITRATGSLFDMGALDEEDDDAMVTQLGEVMVALPTDPGRSVMLMLGLAFDCVEEAIVMVAYSAST
jgi:HrpA-like RNA helicase